MYTDDSLIGIGPTQQRYNNGVGTSRARQYFVVENMNESYITTLHIDDFLWKMKLQKKIYGFYYR